MAKTVNSKRSTPTKPSALQAFADELSILQDQLNEADPSSASIELDFTTTSSALASVVRLSKHLSYKLLQHYTAGSRTPSQRSEVADLSAKLKLKSEELKQARGDLASLNLKLKETQQKLQVTQRSGRDGKQLRRVNSSFARQSSHKQLQQTSSPPSLEIAKYRELVDSGRLLENFDGEISAYIEAQTKTIEAYQHRIHEAESRSRHSESASTYFLSRPTSALSQVPVRSDSKLVADLQEQVAYYREQIKILSSQVQPERVTKHVSPRVKAQLEEVNELFATKEIQLAANNWLEAGYLELDGESYEWSFECLREVAFLRDSQLAELMLQVNDSRMLLDKFHVELQDKDIELETLQKSLAGNPKRNINAEYEASALHDKVDFMTKTMSSHEARIKSLSTECSSLQQLKAKLEAKVRTLENELKVSLGASETDRLRELIGVIRRKDDEIQSLLERVGMLDHVDDRDYDLEGLHRECDRLRALVNTKEAVIEDLQRTVDAVSLPISYRSHQNSRPTTDSRSFLRPDSTDHKRSADQDLSAKLKVSEESLKARDCEVGRLKLELEELQEEVRLMKEVRVKLGAVSSHSRADKVQSPHFRSQSIASGIQEYLDQKTVDDAPTAKKSSALQEERSETQFADYRGGMGSRLGRVRSPSALAEFSSRLTSRRESYEHPVHELAGTTKGKSRSLIGEGSHVTSTEQLSVQSSAVYTQHEYEDLQRELKQYKDTVRSTQLREKDSKVSELLASVSQLTQSLKDLTNKDAAKQSMAEQRKPEDKDREMTLNYVRKEWVEELLGAVELAEVDLIVDSDQLDLYSRIQRAVAHAKRPESSRQDSRRDHEGTPKMHGDISAAKRDIARLEHLQESFRQILGNKEKTIKDIEGKLQGIQGDVAELQGLIYQVFEVASFQYTSVTGSTQIIMTSLCADLRKFLPFLHSTSQTAGHSQDTPRHTASSRPSDEFWKSQMTK
jgi:cell division protein ZapA (FtsZ GTPase activity inhibitor)